MYINQKWTIVKGNDIKNKAKIASIVFEEGKMQNKYNSIHHRRNMFLVVTMAGTENRDTVCLSVYGRVTESGRGAPNFGPCLLWPNGRPSQQVQSSCIVILCQKSSQLL